MSQVSLPDDFVTITRELVDDHFPEDRYEGELIDGIDIRFQKIRIGNVPVRIILAAEVLAFGCEESNRGDALKCRQLELKPKYANMFMPLSLYLLMRKGATFGEARMSSK